MAAGIASGFVRKLYRILDQESDAVVGWDPSGLSFSIHDSQKLNDSVLPRYFRGRMSAFRQQLLDHGFEQLECEDNEVRECYRHPHFLRGFPDRLSCIVRVPKPKLKPGQSPSSIPQPQVRQPPPQLQQQQQQPPSQFHHVANGHSTASSYQQSSLGVHIAPSNRGPGRTPLTVTLSAGKRPSPSHASTQADFASKRLRSATPMSTMTLHRPTGPVQAPAPPVNLSRNPLFSNDSSTDLGLDVARVFSMSRISDSGLMPNSTDLPEPISYLNKILHASETTCVAAIGVPSSASSSSVSSSATPSIDTPVFSEDLMKSALYFLVSTSTTGVGPDHNLTTSASRGNGTAGSNSSSTWAAHMEKLSTSGFLSSLLVSSATGKDTGSGAPSLSSASVWGPPSANPLFSKSSEQDEEEEDSIWSLLLASSIDRVKSAIHDVVSPQERLRLILEERERLEEQRKRIYGLNGQASGESESAAPTASTTGPYKPTTNQSAKPLKSALKKPTSAPTNPLFKDVVKEETASNSVLFENTSFSPGEAPAAAPAKSVNPLFADDDDDEDDSASAGNPLFSKASNQLFSKTTGGSEISSTPPVSASARPFGAGAAGAEDGLWRLLMTSSVDWLRKGAAEFEI